MRKFCKSFRFFFFSGSNQSQCWKPQASSYAIFFRSNDKKKTILVRNIKKIPLKAFFKLSRKKKKFNRVFNVEKTSREWEREKKIIKYFGHVSFHFYSYSKQENRNFPHLHRSWNLFIKRWWFFLDPKLFIATTIYSHDDNENFFDEIQA